MILFPAIDLKDGQAVRLKLGREHFNLPAAKPKNLSRRFCDFIAEHSPAHQSKFSTTAE